jgi:hypothetical protein
LTFARCHQAQLVTAQNLQYPRDEREGLLWYRQTGKEQKKKDCLLLSEVSEDQNSLETAQANEPLNQVKA